MGANSGTGGVEAHYEMPDTETLRQAGEMPIKDEHGNPLPFKTLFTDKPDGQRQLIVFIRHFFCGLCEDYVRSLTKDLAPEKLAESSVVLTIVGCGEYTCIADYKVRTGCPFDIYCDPTRKLYSKLGMQTTLSPGKKPEYLKTTLLGNAWNSALNALSSGRKAIQGGNYSQNGGEWEFQSGQVQWCRKMRNTMDHAEIKELKQVLEIDVN